MFKILEMAIKSFDIIYERHKNIFEEDNLDLLYIIKNDVKKVIFIEFIFKNKKPKISFLKHLEIRKLNL